MKTGCKVIKIFYDPITEIKLEGEARLMRIVDEMPDGLCAVLVRFNSESSSVYRLIKKENLHQPAGR